MGQGGLGGGSVPAVHSSHSQPAACSRRAGRGLCAGVCVLPAPAPPFSTVGGTCVCGTLRGVQGEPSGYTGTRWLLLVLLSPQSPGGSHV